LLPSLTSSPDRGKWSLLAGTETKWQHENLTGYFPPYRSVIVNSFMGYLTTLSKCTSETGTDDKMIVSDEL
jgi:hypothetical protein